MIRGLPPKAPNSYICYHDLMGERLTFITSNRAKAQQLGLHLGVELEHQAIELTEIQSLDLEEVVAHKAREAFEAVKRPVLVEDMAMVFNAFGRLPGPLVKWFFQEIGAEGLCRLLDGQKDRTGKAMVVFGYYDGNTLKTYSGEVNGIIADAPRGKSGFPSDTIFIPDGHDKTWSEMSAEEQADTSIRRVALKKLEADLRR